MTVIQHSDGGRAQSTRQGGTRPCDLRRVIRDGCRPLIDPIPIALLEQQNATREPDLVPVRHGRMMVSPFTFYRGAAKIMAADLKEHSDGWTRRPALR